MTNPTLKLSRQELMDISVLLQLRVNQLRDINRPAYHAVFVWACVERIAA